MTLGGSVRKGGGESGGVEGREGVKVDGREWVRVEWRKRGG